MNVKFTDVGHRILTQIKACGLSQVDIHNKSGLSTTAISNYCTEKRLPDTTALYKIASILGVSMEWILTGEDATSEDSDSALLDLTAIKEEQGLICDGSPLNDEETDLVAMYRLLPDYRKEDVFDIIHTMYQKHVERKKDSIYWTYKEDKLKQKGTTADDDSQGGIA